MSASSPPGGRDSAAHDAPVLFVENDDSFTWNVVEALPFPRERVRMLPGARVAAGLGVLDRCVAVVVGPGPKDPERAGIVGIIRAAAQRRLPTLGICLGHQALGLAFGARMQRVTPCHGKTSRLRFGDSRLLPGLAGDHVVMRYHSLAVRDVVPPLRVVAETGDGLPMLLEHATLPMLGMQFHPDSHGTPGGPAMVAAFFRAVGLAGGAP